MTNKRLLLIQDDLVLSGIYRDRLELAGFIVEVTRGRETCLRLIEELRPDAVILDPILMTGDVASLITEIRSIVSGVHVPILLLPTTHAPLANAALQAGASVLVEKSGTPLTSIVAEVKAATGSGPASRTVDTIDSVLDPQWQRTALNAVPETLAAMRHSLHEIVRNPSSGTVWRELLLRTHALAGQISLVDENAMSHLATALEVLVYGLECYPERINALTLRTMGQAVDFLATLWEREAYLHPLDLRTSHVLIVEDEPSARDLISAAMQLVGLSADGLESPGASLAVLSSQPFDLIFMDINLPEMNGFEVCTKIRELSLHERTPIIFLTGMSTFQNRVQSSLSGGNDFVGKPFNVAELGVKALIWILKGRLGVN